MADPICQKIIVNLDSDMSIGRLYAQAAHASWLAVLPQGYWDENNLVVPCDKNHELKSWLKDQFTKVILKGYGDQMLLDLKEKAEIAGLPVGLMEEDGYVTALAVGPADTKDIDRAIGKLKLL